MWIIRSLTLGVVVLVLLTGGGPSFAQVRGEVAAEDRAGIQAVSQSVRLDPPPPRRAGGRQAADADVYQFVTSDELLDLLEQLTSIRPHLGWRHSTTTGESDAISWVQEQLAELGFLGAVGLTSERTPFRTFTGVDFWETSVTLHRGNSSFEAPADGAPGHRDNVALAMRFDSDGVLNDRNRDPVIVEGDPIVIRSVDEIYGLTPQQLAGKIAMVDYAVIDRSLLGTNEAVTRAWVLMEKRPAAVVMVTTYDNRSGRSHGAFAGDLSAYTWVDIERQIPVLSLRMEDLGDFGIHNWNGLQNVDHIRVTWDVDLFAPGDSEYLVARIPGLDSSRAVILGAHIDSPNTPGAFDNGSGSSALVQVARALDRARLVPPVDLYLAWFGSHERGLYGSGNFTANSSELLDRSIAMLQMDCLGHPLDGIVNQIWLETWSYGSYGNGSIPWPSYVQDLASDQGIGSEVADIHGLVSDNSSFAGYGVPNINMIFMNPYSNEEVHFANHLHDPYDDMPLALLEGEAFEEMATIMVSAAINTGADDPDLRVTPNPTRRALFVGSHTEAIHMSPAGLTDFGMSLAWEGFDVDMVPYGRAVTPDDLVDTDLVIALPVHDYPTPEVDTGLYDEAWTEDEIDALEDFVESGGVLVVTNSVHRLKYYNLAFDDNEDWPDVNALAGRFGIEYSDEVFTSDRVLVNGDHPLVDDVQLVYFISGNARAFDAGSAEVLGSVGGRPAVAVLQRGAGAVVVLADLGTLGATHDPPRNLQFWRNLAQFAR